MAVKTVAPKRLASNHGRVAELPVIDLSSDSNQLRAALREVAHEVGFFYLTGHGVSPQLVHEVLSAARKLFALSEADKEAIAMVRSPHFRGFTRLGGELTGGLTDWREQIDVGPERAASPTADGRDYMWLQGPNQWPHGGSRAQAGTRKLGHRAGRSGAKAAERVGHCSWFGWRCLQ